MLFRAFVIAGAVFLFGLNTGGRAGGPVLWTTRPRRRAPFVAATIAGFAFTWWARLTIGKLWSSGVTRKAEHRVVDTGPYGLVRHPIYTGLILSAFATAFVPLTPMTLVGAALISFGFFLKARLEEQFLRGGTRARCVCGVRPSRPDARPAGEVREERRNHRLHRCHRFLSDCRHAVTLSAVSGA